MDPNIIRELNQRFSELTSTSNSLGSSFTSTKTQSDKLSGAFEKLSKQVDKNTKDSKELNEVTQKSVEVEKKSLEATEKRTKADEEAAKVTLENSKKAGDAARGIMAQTSSVDGLLSVMSDRLIALAGGGVAATAAIKGLQVVVEGGIRILQASYEAQVTYTKSLLAGERGQILAARQATQVGKSFNELVSNLGSVAMGVGGIAAILGGPVTMLLGGLAAAGGVAAKIFSHLSNTTLELNEQLAGLKDKLFQGFNELGKASMIGAGGMTELHRQLHELGLTMAEVSEFTGLVKGAGKELRLFGASTSEGLKSFVKTTGSLLKSDLGRTLEIMGITAADQRESMLSFMTTEAKLGKARITDQEKLNKAAFNYIIEMDKLAELTGATRKEQEEARAAILGIEELRAAIMDEEDPKEKAKLERAMKQAEVLFAAGAKNLAAGVAKYFAAGEAITSPEATKAFLNVPKLLDNLSKGIGTTAENQVLAGEEMAEFAKSFAGTARLQGDATKGILAEGYGVINDLVNRQKGANEEEKKKGVSLDEYLKKLREVTDKQTIAQADLMRSLRDKAQKEELTAGTMEHAVEKFKESVYYLVEKLGLKGTPESSSGQEADLKQAQAVGGLAGVKSDEERRKLLPQVTQHLLKLKEYEKYYNEGMKLTDKQLQAQSMAQTEIGKQAIAMYKKSYERQSTTGDTTGGTTGGTTVEKDPLSGLDFGGKKEERTGGGQAEPNLISMAHKINEMFPGVTITALNDKFHQERDKDKDLKGKSKHTIGKALDFSLQTPPKDAEEADAISKEILNMGASSVRDEYFKEKNNNTRGGHFHVEVAHDGGYFKSNLGDFPVLLKNDEYVLTNRMVENLKSKLEDNVTKSPIDTVFPEATTPASTAPKNEMGDLLGMFIKSQEQLSDKLDTMITVLESGVSLQDKLVKYART